ncbi:hypothetical protein AXG93_3267s1040 [Marchantia polymorpha subsp. ruderalis]|uniref:Uncharacterized protein n=1 Tax=Marchantia polymorpha subsp. ruderalis TaxID=1480154 RepID=A0A176WQR4_MARPO|nr:hypothetical protein AXG93_3267s1040 [Marchantia polymorpha subsp. ruderalis]
MPVSELVVIEEFGGPGGPWRIYAEWVEGGVDSSGGASSIITEGTSGAATNGGAVSVASSSTSGKATDVPLFSPISEFFKRLRNNYQGILDRELRRRVRDATLSSDALSTLAYVFAQSQEIELNIVEERVMTSSFARDTTTTPRIL